MTGRHGKRRKQQLDDLMETTEKEKALGRSLSYERSIASSKASSPQSAI